LNWGDDKPFVASPTLLAVRNRIVHNVSVNKQANELIDGRISISSLFKVAPDHNGNAVD
jgi:hypothetical protein